MIFFFSTLGDAEWSYSLDTSTVKSCGRFSTTGGLTQSYVLLGHFQGDIIVQSPSGIKIWSLFDPFHRWLAVTYFMAFSPPGWQSLFPNGSSLRADPQAYIGCIESDEVTQKLYPTGYLLEEGVTPLCWKNEQSVPLYMVFVQGSGRKKSARKREFQGLARFGDAMDLPPPRFG